MAKRHAKRADEKRHSAGLVLDAGALQALERRPLRLLADLHLAHDLGLPIRIPAGALAQSWRGGPRSATLARLLKQRCEVIPLDARTARQVGQFIAAVHTNGDLKPDIVDAHVALTTRATHSLVWTSDPDDLLRYGVDAIQIRKI